MLLQPKLIASMGWRPSSVLTRHAKRGVIELGGTAPNRTFPLQFWREYRYVWWAGSNKNR